MNAGKRFGAPPISTRWVQVVKTNDDGGYLVLCRLVGRDNRPKGDRDREELFAAVPPFEAKRMLFRVEAESSRVRTGANRPELKLMFIDFRLAHLSSECDEDVYVDLPDEFDCSGQVGKLRR